MRHPTGVALFCAVDPGVAALCTPGDRQVLELALQAANEFTPLAADERVSVLTNSSRTK
jgi:hypothetical protein